MNSVTISGNLCRDVELRTTQTGRTMVSNTLGVSAGKNANGEYQTDFIDVVFFDAQANFVNQYCAKGSKLVCNGQIKANKYQNEQGQTVTKVNVLVREVEVMSKKETQPTQEQKQEAQQQSKPYTPDEADIDDSDLPF